MILATKQWVEDMFKSLKPAKAGPKGKAGTNGKDGTEGKDGLDAPATLTEGNHFHYYNYNRKEHPFNVTKKSRVFITCFGSAKASISGRQDVYCYVDNVGKGPMYQYCEAYGLYNHRDLNPWVWQGILEPGDHKIRFQINSGGITIDGDDRVTGIIVMHEVAP